MVVHTNSEAREHFEREGYVIIPKVLDADLIGEAREHVEWIMNKYPGTETERLGNHLVHNDPFWLRLVSDDRLLDVAEQFIGPDISLYASAYHNKPAKVGRAVTWHQDGAYWPLEPQRVVTLWLAIDDSLPENGCMRVIPRSHLMSIQEVQEQDASVSLFQTGLDPNSVDESLAIDLELRAGGVSAHHPQVIHGSKVNRSDLRRCGLTIAYIPTSTKIISDGPWPTAFLLRGNSVPGINEYQPLPRYTAGEHMPFIGCELWK